MDRRRLGRTEQQVSAIGFGSFKIGRNLGIKYPRAYDLPDDEQAAHLLNGVLDLGINLVDTAPAYGLSEERIGNVLDGRRNEIVLTTKVGETFRAGQSTYDFSNSAVRRSVQRSLRRLRTDVIDVLLIHSDGRDLDILEQTDVVETLHDLRDAGLTRAIGFSGKTLEGAQAALLWADVIMVEYNPGAPSHADIMTEAASADIGVLVKKGLASGHTPAAEAIPFVLGHPAVASMIVGGLSLTHARENLAIASSLSTSLSSSSSRSSSQHETKTKTTT